MITNNKKFKGFTLIELLVAVSIFVVVVLIAMATLSISVSTKSKVIGLNELRGQGGKAMSDIESIIINANKGDGINYYGIGVKNDAGFVGSLSGGCKTIGGSFPGSQIIASFQDSKKYTSTSTIKYNTAQQKLYLDRTITDPNNNNVGSVSDQLLISDNIKVTSFIIDNYNYAANTTCNRSSYVNVKLTLQAATRGNVGQTPEITLVSTFTSKYPNPSKAGDSS